MSRLENSLIVLTRPRAQSAALRQELERRGAEVVLAPLIRTEPIQSPENDARLRTLHAFDWVIFTSANGVEFCALHLQRLGVTMASPHPRIAAIGRATASAAESRGWSVSLLPPHASSEGLAEAMKGAGAAGARVALLAAERTRDILPQVLAEMGAQVTAIPLYRPVPDPEGVEALRSVAWERVSAVVFLSGSAAEVFAQHLPAEAPGHALYCAAGSATAERMEALGIPADIVSGEPSTDGIVRTLEEWLAD